MSKLSIAAFCSLLLASCTAVLSEDSTVLTEKYDSFAAAKIINSDKDVYKDQLMFKLTANEDVPSDIGAYADIDGVISCEKLFPSCPGKEEMERRFGLDKWYLLNLADGANLRNVALSVASVPQTDIVQYCKKMRKNFDDKSYPFDPSLFAPVTKAQTTSWCPFDDPNVAYQWHYFNTGDKSIAPTARAGADVNIKDAWKLTQGDPSIIVAVIDEGVYADHADLSANMWTNPGEIPNNGIDDDGNGYIDDVHGYNFVCDCPVSCSEYDSGHGTHIAGVISGVNNNGVGICGLAGGNGTTGGVKIMSCQVFDYRKNSSAAFVRAFKYAADNGASIAQCSYGYDATAISTDAEFAAIDHALIDAADYFLATNNCPNALDGSVAIFAAGNDSHNNSGYPGGYYKYISVASIASDNLPAYYTNYGPGVNICAPGGEYYTGGQYNRQAAVLSTLPPINSDNTGYGYMQGTSMACPHVTGVAALGLSYMLKRGIHLSNNEFMSKLLTSVNDIDDLLIGEKLMIVGKSLANKSLSPYRKNMGTGSIDAWRFLMQLDGTPCLTAIVGESQRLNISDYFGGCSKNLTYLSCEISQEDMEALGLEKKPEISYGRLKIEPTKAGCAQVHIKAIAGGETLGDGVNTGGIELNRTVSIIARSVKSSNGGWL